MRLVITESCVKEDKAKLKDPPLKTKPRRESVVDKSPYFTKTRPSQVEVTGKPMLQAPDALKIGEGMILQTDSSLNDLKNPLEELGYISQTLPMPAVDPQVILNYRSTNHQIRAADILGINTATLKSATD